MKSYSCEEVYERMEKGMCLFCEELDTPDHHLKHERVKIFMTKRDDDQFSGDKEEAHQIQETVTNTDPFVITVKNSDPFIERMDRASVLQVPGSVYDGMLVHKMDLHVQEAKVLPQRSTSSNGNNSGHQLFDQIPLRVISNETKKKRHMGLSQSEHVWEPGGLVCIQDQWDWLNGVKDVISTNMNQEEEPSHEKETRPQLFPYHQVLIFDLEQLRNNILQSHTDIFKSVNGAIYFLSGVCTNRKRPLDPGITEMFKKSLVCSGAPNMKFEAEVEIYFWARPNLKRLITHNALDITNLHEMSSLMSLQTNPETSILMAKVTRNWIVKAGFKIQVCSGFDLALGIGLKIYGYTYKKQMLLFVKQANCVWEPDGVAFEHDKWKEICYKHGRLMRFLQRLSNMWWRYGRVVEFTRELQQKKNYLQEIKFSELDRLAACSFAGIEMWLEIYPCEYNIHMSLLDYYNLEMQVLSCLKERRVMVDSIVLCRKKKLESFLHFVYGKKLLDVSRKMQSRLVCDIEGKHKNIEIEAKKEKNSSLGDCRVILTLAMEEYVVITVAGGNTLVNELKLAEGMKLAIGYISPYLITYQKTQKSELGNPITLIHEKRISELNSLLKVLEAAMQRSRTLLVVGLRQLTFSGMKSHMKHKWRSKQSKRMGQYGERKMNTPIDPVNEISTFQDMVSTFSLSLEDCCEFLMLLNFNSLRVIVAQTEADYLVVLLTFVAVRLLISVAGMIRDPFLTLIFMSCIYQKHVDSLTGSLLQLLTSQVHMLHKFSLTRLHRCTLELREESELFGCTFVTTHVGLNVKLSQDDGILLPDVSYHNKLIVFHLQIPPELVELHDPKFIIQHPDYHP